VRLADLRSDLVILACAISAGIHGALTPSHFDEGTGPGLGFAAATVALTGIVLWLTWRPASTLPLAAAAATLAGLLASYALATTSGVPLLHPHPEPVDGLALATKAIEIVGLLAATSLLRRRVEITHTGPKGALT
jgi:drug/metabolite transporter (DMT)-like permease